MNLQKNFFLTLKLSKNAIRYYADIVEQYAAFRLRRTKQTAAVFLCAVFRLPSLSTNHE